MRMPEVAGVRITVPRNLGSEGCFSTLPMTSGRVDERKGASKVVCLLLIFLRVVLLGF